MGIEQIKVKINPDVTPAGSDLAIVNAARRSFNTRSDWEWGTGHNGHKGALKDKDKRLIEFLARGMTADDFEQFKSEVKDQAHYEYKHDGDSDLVEMLWQWRNTPTHESPFGHCFISFEVKLPLFLARQLVKHKFLRWSEYSRRYITDDVEFYQHNYRESTENKKQGSGGQHPASIIWQKEVDFYNKQQLDLYHRMLLDKVAPEQARGVLPTDLMTAVTWSGSLDAFANMCRLRLGSDAQYEAQVVAKEVYKYLEQYYPVSARSLVYGPK